MTRRRRDPRAELATQSSPGLRGRRIDRCPTSAPLSVRATFPVTAPDQIVRVETPACLIAAIVDAPNGNLTNHDRQVVAAARILAADGGAVLLVTPVAVEGAGVAGADRTLVLPQAHDPHVLARYIADMLDNIAVRHALFAETAFSGDLARRVGAMRGDGVFTDVEHVSLRQVTRPACAGRSEFRKAPPRLMAIAADRVPLYAGAPREARDMDIRFSTHIALGFIDIEDLPHDRTDVALAEADFVVAAGNGVTDFKTFSVLAESLGAAPGASRVVCDAGLMPRDRQVGASGTVLSGTCYLALGIAGAPQHLQGVAGVEHVIAVNTDLHAAMIKRASLAIVADTQKVMPALLARLGSRAPA